MPDDRNVYGTELQPCSTDPMTGFVRDGCCRRVESDRGRHELCAVMTEEFLQFSKARGNDLTSPEPAFEFPGLEPGDRWCLCLARWLEAEEADCAPPVVLEATHEAVLRDVEPDLLREHEYDGRADAGSDGDSSSSSGSGTDTGPETK
ncbi:DUF2237 family protein [Natrinema salifodinae]|uniref:DUF2237 domain-containing protein n=1 Tax=Natrinema salifodinae TaxID=1202768 RepID=A0A1I0PM75_9EURY|nr:DUF2237 domain-containing protein [Natrinema salifodinae]SEW15490.1 hypothetical protein SAMN05216285_2723 [Natrinema salifodinae]